MTRLSPAARAIIRDTADSLSWNREHGVKVSIAGYIREHGGDRWYGDTCGCPDSRCIGYHHDEHEDCRCLDATLEEWINRQRAERDAGPIWAAYQAAIAAHAPVAAAQATAAAARWVVRYHGPGWMSFSFDEVVDGRVGISGRNRWNDRPWLLWTAPTVAHEAAS